MRLRLRLRQRQKEANANEAIRSRITMIGCPPVPNSVRLHLRDSCTYLVDYVKGKVWDGMGWYGKVAKGKKSFDLKRAR